MVTLPIASFYSVTRLANHLQKKSTKTTFPCQWLLCPLRHFTQSPDWLIILKKKPTKTTFPCQWLLCPLRHFTQSPDWLIIFKRNQQNDISLSVVTLPIASFYSVTRLANHLQKKSTKTTFPCQWLLCPLHHFTQPPDWLIIFRRNQPKRHFLVSGYFAHCVILLSHQTG